MKQNIISKNYFNIIVVNYCILLAFRLLETILIKLNFGFQDSLIKSELIGVIYDFISINIFFIVFYPLYYLLHRKAEIIANSIFLIVINLLTYLHLLILKYFLYQLVPLDIFLYQYSISEIFFTINTSDTSYLKILILISIFFTIIFSSYKLSKKRTYSKKTIQAVYFFIIISLPIFILTQIFVTDNFNRYSKNKSLYFYSQSIIYLFNTDKVKQTYTTQDALIFQKLYPSKAYPETNYPLLHNLDTLNPLGACFDKFNSAPNIVILIIEGLNDDFIHNYKGVDLMPFLSNLKDKSLYWNRCFTLGERSFAVVPSILGSLPYGEKGFTLLNRLPRHLSLVSILNSNDYFTSFFYGQSGWFHKKDRFFKYNNIDLIFDNSKFSNKYKKIIVGENNFFWGYNDKDLFNQSLEVIDTISAKHRLDIYFTGTSHSPYIISNEEYYEKHYFDVLGKLKSDEDVNFFNTYKKYIKSILFVDDALEDFFNKYQKRDDYENTIFIITGDHPMTEIPIANSLKKYHVPLIIFSEKLIKSQTISNTISHLDISESILPLMKPYGINIPSISSSLGDKLDIDTCSDRRRFAFMNDNREIVDFYSEGYFISGEQTYKVDQKLNLTKINDNDIWNKLNEELNTFKKTNLHICLENKVLPDSEYCKSLNHTLIYSLKNTGLVKFSREFHDLIPTLEIKNQDSFYEIAFKYTGNIDDFSFVYQLTDKNDSVLLWRNIGISEEKKYFQAHIKIPYQTITDSTVYLKSCFWNQKKKEFKYSDLSILIHRE